MSAAIAALRDERQQGVIAREDHVAMHEALERAAYQKLQSVAHPHFSGDFANSDSYVATAFRRPQAVALQYLFSCQTSCPSKSACLP